ncbi:MAG: DUF3348 domain-containing protein [Burkholderiaceae bacterium]
MTASARDASATATASKFHSSQLIRSLADLGMLDAVDPGDAFAEQLGQWIHFADAITLSAVHGEGIAQSPKVRPDVQSAARTAIGAEFERVQASLANSIAKSCTPNVGRAHIALPAPDPDLPLNVGAAYAPYRRFYEAHQRDMELGIQPLRTNVRSALAKTSPTLRKLADLDAAMEKMLRERESKLLAKVPVLLKKRFERLFKEHQQTLAAAQQTDNPATWMKTGGWLARFCKDMQMLLLAELDLRLQPTMGLMEALTHDT